MCSCVGYTENQKFDLLQDEFQIKSPNYLILPMRVTYVQFQARNPSCQNLECVCEISMLPTYYLPSSFGNVYCVFNYGWKIQISRCIGYLPWPLPLLQKIQNKNCTQNRKNPRNCYYIFNSPPLVWLSLSRESISSSVAIIITVLTCITRSFLGFKKTGCRRRNVLKEDLVAED